jgi:hypothetical protein
VGLLACAVCVYGFLNGVDLPVRAFRVFGAPSGTDSSVCSTTYNLDRLNNAENWGSSMSVGTGTENGLKWDANAKKSSKAADEGVRSTLAGAAKSESRIFAALSSKQRGELAEMMFMVKAAQKGFATAKPYGDSRRL